MKNEATLSSRIDNLLTVIFPTFRSVATEHQGSFTLKFGHRNLYISTENENPKYVKAIYDVLITVGGKNAILLELKKEGLKLDSQDKEQALSYARLLDPMPPLTILSNGTKTEFYNTYTKKFLNSTIIDVDFIESLISNGFELANNDLKNAVELLLGKDPQLFSGVINGITEEKFSRMEGKVDDFSKPISKDFQIGRNQIAGITGLFDENKQIVGLIGGPFSGKTNVLYQFYASLNTGADGNHNFVFFIDCKDHNYSILQQLANRISQETKVYCNKDKVREWMINSLNEGGGVFYLLVDNFDNEVPELIKNEVLELIDLFRDSNNRILFTTDARNFEKISIVENRQYQTILGNLSTIIVLEPLSTEEYKAANDYLLEKFKAPISLGGQFNVEYREPRVLRQLMAAFDASDLPDKKIIQLPAVVNYEILKVIAGEAHFPEPVHRLYEKLAICFLEELESPKTGSIADLATHGSGAVTFDAFQRRFGRDIWKLLKSDLVELKELNNGPEILVPKIPELTALLAIPLIRDKVLALKNQPDTGKICDKFLDLVTHLPYYDVIGARILIEIAIADGADLFSEMVLELLSRKPNFVNVKAGTKIRAYVEGKGAVELSFDEDTDQGQFMENIFPFMILSQLAASPLQLIGDTGHGPYAFHLHLLYELGSTKYFVHKNDLQNIEYMPQIERNEFEEGVLVKNNQGVVEPIVQAIQDCFAEIPDDVRYLYARGFQENNIILIWRIYLAIAKFRFSETEKLAAYANEFLEQFHPYFGGFMAEKLSENITDEDEKAAMKALVLSLKMNENLLDNRSTEKD